MSHISTFIYSVRRNHDNDIKEIKIMVSLQQTLDKVNKEIPVAVNFEGDELAILRKPTL